MLYINKTILSVKFYALRLTPPYISNYENWQYPDFCTKMTSL